MKKSIVVLIAIGFLCSFKTFAQESDKLFGIKFSGFVKNDFIFDTRQIVSARDGHFLLYPQNERLDMDGEDINAKASFNYLAIQSRLTGKITGPDAFGAKTSGVIEGAFFGQLESNINSFRLRHAYVKLNWETTEVLLGQYWHLMFNTDCYPGTVSFNTGVPMQFFSRNPQIRISQKIGDFKLTGVAATQLDFVSPGGSEALRNAIVPNLIGQLGYTKENLHLGLTAGYKSLLPRLETNTMYKATSTIGGFTSQASAKYTTEPLTFKIQATYAQNGYDGLSIGGYAVSSITDPLRDYRSYTTINTVSYWGDFHTNGKKLQGGLFVGYIKNLGSNDVIDDISLLPTYTRGHNIASVYRVAPRMILNSGKIRFAAEYELTGAAYGATISNKAVPQNTKIVNNNRLLVAVYYFF